MDVCRTKLAVRIKRQEQEQKFEEIFRSRTVECYTRERIKNEEKEILQRHTTSLYIKFVRHFRTVFHASMYRLHNYTMILHT
jgi:rRNA maturation protein Rpf1